MDQNFQTSFIPKKPMIRERAASSQPVGIFFIASLFILITVLLATGGIYFYRRVLIQQIGDMKFSLDKDKARFEPQKIAELQVLDKRLRASSEILSNHITITPIFQALEDITMKNVRYTKFSYDLGTDKGAKVNIKMSGQAIGYLSIALQADLFAKRPESKNFIDPVFSNLTLDNSGNVNFDLDFSVDPSFINYRQTLQAQS